MNKEYFAPTIEVEIIEASDVILASGYTIEALEGVDTGDDVSAVFDVNRWF